LLVLNDQSQLSRVLIAGFSPDPEKPQDISCELALSAGELDVAGVSISVLELPRSWSEAFPMLRDALVDEWDALILVSGANSGSVAVERLALNENDGREKDSTGRRAETRFVSEGGEIGYWTGLPYRELVIEMSSKGVPCYASHNAGGGVPNFVFYKLMEFVSRRDSGLMCGLVQLPFAESLRFMEKVKPELILPILVKTLFELDEREDRLAIDLGRLARLRESPTP